MLTDITATLPALLGATLLLAACAPAADQSVSSTAALELRPAYAEFNTDLTIREVMNNLIDPSADALWTAVKFEMDENGSRELRPESDEDWAALRQHAVFVIEGGNALMIPGRRVAPPGATTEFPAYEYQPDEVDAILRQDWQSWQGFAQGLQASAFDMLRAIDARDADLLSEYGAALDEACESCHSRYWYRSMPQ
jgi:hypothetical protein